MLEEPDNNVKLRKRNTWGKNRFRETLAGCLLGDGEEDLGKDNRTLGGNSWICFLSVEIR